MLQIKALLSSVIFMTGMLYAQVTEPAEQVSEPMAGCYPIGAGTKIHLHGVQVSVSQTGCDAQQFLTVQTTESQLHIAASNFYLEVISQPNAPSAEYLAVSYWSGGVCCLMLKHITVDAKGQLIALPLLNLGRLDLPEKCYAASRDAGKPCFDRYESLTPLTVRLDSYPLLFGSIEVDASVSLVYENPRYTWTFSNTVARAHFAGIDAGYTQYQPNEQQLNPRYDEAFEPRYVVLDFLSYLLEGRLYSELEQQAFREAYANLPAAEKAMLRQSLLNSDYWPDYERYYGANLVLLLSD